LPARSRNWKLLRRPTIRKKRCEASSSASPISVHAHTSLPTSDRKVTTSVSAFRVRRLSRRNPSDMLAPTRSVRSGTTSRLLTARTSIGVGCECRPHDYRSKISASIPSSRVRRREVAPTRVTTRRRCGRWQEQGTKTRRRKKTVHQRGQLTKTDRTHARYVVRWKKSARRPPAYTNTTRSMRELTGHEA